MLRKLVGAVLATALAAAAAASPAGAMTGAKPTVPAPSVTLVRHMGPGLGSGMGPHIGPHTGPIHSGTFFGHHHRHFRNFVVGFPYYDYDYYGSYGSCGWLHHRAVVTGSRYWWHRYYECVGPY